jgi:hypothetical protein
MLEAGTILLSLITIFLDSFLVALRDLEYFSSCCGFVWQNQLEVSSDLYGNCVICMDVIYHFVLGQIFLLW